MGHWHSHQKYATWLLDDNAKPHRYASIITYIDQINLQRWLQPAYSPDLSPCDRFLIPRGVFHALKKLISRLPYPATDLLQEVIDRKIAYKNANDKSMAVQKL